MVERLFAFMEHMVTNLANEEIVTVAHNAKEAMGHAAAEASSHQSSGGMLATLKMLSNPESQLALQFMLSFACEMRNLSVDEK